MSLDYQRYFFRRIAQNRNDSFDSFVKRLMDQLPKCKFQDPMVQLKDQIIEKCDINGLRQRAFESDMSVDQVILTGYAIENWLENSHSTSTSNFTMAPPHTQFCTRCGQTNHDYTDRNCPAQKTSCSLCYKPGHLAMFCRSGIPHSMKRQASTGTGTIKVPKISGPSGHLMDSQSGGKIEIPHEASKLPTNANKTYFISPARPPTESLENKSVQQQLAATKMATQL